jgi:hypothetical protein
MRERGTALLVAVFALALMGALVATAFHVGLLEQRTGRNALYAAEAAVAADAAAAEVLGNWEAYPQLPALATGDSVTLPRVALGGHAAAQATVVRLGDALYLTRGHGSRLDGSGEVLAQRRVTVLVRALGAAVAPLAQRSWALAY